MVYNLLSYRRPSYRRPSFVKSLSDSASSCKGSSDEASISLQTSRNSSCRSLGGIPEELSFERVVDGSTCSPVTCRDFMNYLTYVERCAENLQFMLWYRDYIKRFEALSANQQALSPKYTPPTLMPQHSPALTRPPGVSKASENFVNKEFEKHSASIRDTAAERSTTDVASPFITPPRTPYDGVVSPFFKTASVPKSLMNIDYRQATSDAFEKVDVKWQPFTVQPFRDEISRIIAIYLSEGSPRELNLSSRDRIAVIKALGNTTHPSSMQQVNCHVENLLRYQSHPNFIRWSTGNGNKPRVVFAIVLGVFLIAVGTLTALLITLGTAGRGYRALGAIGWMTGTATLFGGLKGMFVVLHGRHRRNLRPWELWGDGESKGSKDSFETEISSNSYENEPWIEKYKQRNIIRKVFDRELWIEEPALKQIQDTVALQGVILAALVSVLLTALFVAVPRGGYF